MSFDLRLGDCLDPVTGLALLPDRSVDHVICDPPYEAEAHTKGRRARAAGGGEIYNETPLDFVAITDNERIRAGAELARVACRWILVFCQVEAAMKWRAALETREVGYVRTCVWTKPDATPQFTGDRPGMGYESIVVCHRAGKKRWNGGGTRGVFEFSGDRDREHMTQKPVALMEKLVRLFTDPGDTILDPFAGSGTTGVAAIRLGRKFIGWERDPRYHAIAMKRIRAAREQLELCA